MLLILALLLAIPTYGLSIVLYVIWTAFRYRRRTINLNELSDVEKAVFHVAEKERGFATCFNELSYNDVGFYVIANRIKHKRIGVSYSEEQIEFDMRIGACKYDVLVSREPKVGNKGAVFRARRSQPKLDELSEWMEDSFGSRLIGKYYLLSQRVIRFGAAHAPEHRPESPIEVPEIFGELANLEYLAFINQHIVSLPRTIGKLTKLKELKLGGNDIEHLPSEICNLVELELFTIWMNGLKELPSEFGALLRLKGLDLSDNDLTRLPDSIINLSNLERFYITGNEGLKLTTPQKNWIVGLIERDAVVEIDDDRYAQLRAEYPYLPAAQKGRVN